MDATIEKIIPTQAGQEGKEKESGGKRKHKPTVITHRSAEGQFSQYDPKELPMEEAIRKAREEAEGKKRAEERQASWRVGGPTIERLREEDRQREKARR